MKLLKYTKESIEDLSKTGVYKITCTSNDKIYIGSASGTKGHSKTHKGFYGRWKSHISKLSNNEHRNKHLQSAWNLYGEDAFSFEILEFLEPELCESKEIYWIDFYDSCNKEKGFNFIRQPLRNMGPQSEETRKKISKSLLGHSVSESIKARFSKPVLQYDLDNNFISEYKSMTEAEKITGIDRTSIKNVCKNKIRSTRNFIWKYKNPENLYNRKYTNNKQIFLKNIETNELLEFNSINNCAKFIDYNRCTVRSYINSDKVILQKYLIIRKD